MSKIAVISDIHSNIHALNLALKDIEKKNIDKIICLGDIVVKYFYPDRVVDAIKNNCEIIVKGNCDNLVVNDSRYKFARSKLGLDRMNFLSELPIKKKINLNGINIYFYHASPISLEKIFNPLFLENRFTDYKDKVILDYKKMFENENAQISIVGHTHQHYIAFESQNTLKLIKDKVFIDKNQRAIINVGSVGEHSHIILNNQSYETIIDPYITYAIIDDSYSHKIKVEIVKIPYKKTLENVYFDMLKLQQLNKIPYSPKDTKKISKSLKLMRNVHEK